MGALARGDATTGAQRLRNWLRRTLKQPEPARTEDLSDLCADGEIEWSLGDAAIGGSLLQAVLALPDDDDLLAPLRERARALLAAGPGVDLP